MSGQSPQIEGEDAAPQLHSAQKRWLLRLTRLIVLVYVGMCVVLFALQDSLIFPGRSTQGQQHAIIRESTDHRYELVQLTTSHGDKIVALYGSAQDSSGHPRADAQSRATVVFFYGNGMCLADCFGIFEDMRKLGANVLMVEYVGYGMSSGKPSEAAFYETADAAWDHLQGRNDIDRTRIIAAGWSLGAAVAIDLASRKPAAGLITLSAFSSMHDMGRRMLPWLPTGLLLRHRFDNLQKIASLSIPILIAHGKHDRIIPSDMSLQLQAAAKASPKATRVEIDADHNDIFEAQDAIYGPMAEFIDSFR